MNEWDIEQACNVYADHPTLGPAARTLANLRRTVNENSDGWPYWRAPQRASAKLQTLVYGEPRDRWTDRPDVTIAAVKKAYTPIRTFLTKRGLSCEFEIPTSEPGETND